MVIEVSLAAIGRRCLHRSASAPDERAGQQANIEVGDTTTAEGPVTTARRQGRKVRREGGGGGGGARAGRCPKATKNHAARGGVRRARQDAGTHGEATRGMRPTKAAGGQRPTAPRTARQPNAKGQHRPRRHRARRQPLHEAPAGRNATHE